MLPRGINSRGPFIIPHYDASMCCFLAVYVLFALTDVNLYMLSLSLSVWARARVNTFGLLSLCNGKIRLGPSHMYSSNVYPELMKISRRSAERVCQKFRNGLYWLNLRHGWIADKGAFTHTYRTHATLFWLFCARFSLWAPFLCATTACCCRNNNHIWTLEHKARSSSSVRANLINRARRSANKAKCLDLNACWRKTATACAAGETMGRHKGNNGTWLGSRL